MAATFPHGSTFEEQLLGCDEWMDVFTDHMDLPNVDLNMMDVQVMSKRHGTIG